MASIPIDAVFNNTIYAKSRINKFSFPGGQSIGVIPAGDIIGKIYSYVVYDGKVFWMIDNIFGTQTFFIQHDPIAINLPNKQAILNDIARKAEAQKLNDKGIVQYNIDKYLPYIIGGGILAIALPSILGAQKISGMKKNNNKTFILLAAAGVAAYLLTKKKTKAGKPVIEVIDEGFVNELQSNSQQVNVKPVTLEDSFGNRSIIETVQPIQSGQYNSGAGGSGGNGYIDFVGPFKAIYNQDQNLVAGYRKKGNLGRYKTN